MPRSRAVLLMLLLAPVACRAPDATPTATDRPALDQPAAEVAPATAPAPATLPSPATLPAPATTAPVPSAPPADTLARFDGYGDLRFGMTAAQAKQAWGGELNGTPGPGEPCYYLTPVSNPAPSYFAFMIDGDRFVRYDVGNDKEVAPGGGRRGMGAADIARLYPGRVEARPHKYVDGGQYLRIKDAAGTGVLLFETDAAGKVTRWRVGVPPQVDWIEGCA